MVAGDGQHVGLLAQQDGQRGVEFLDRLLLRGEVAVLAVHVGVFEVDEEVVVVVVFGEVALELLGDGLRPFELGHADQLGQALVHRIDGNAARAQAIAVLEQRDVRLVGNAAHQEAVGGLLLRNDRQGGLVELGHQLGGLLGLGGLGVHRRGLRDGQALAMRVGVGQRPFQAFAAEDHHEAMALAGLDDDLGVAELLHLLRQQGAEFFADLGVNAAGAPVGDDAFGVERAEVGARRHVAGAAAPGPGPAPR